MGLTLVRYIKEAILTRILNCCHRFAKFIFPSSLSGFPI